VSPVGGPRSTRDNRGALLGAVILLAVGVWVTAEHIRVTVPPEVQTRAVTEAARLGLSKDTPAKVAGYWRPVGMDVVVYFGEGDNFHAAHFYYHDGQLSLSQLTIGEPSKLGPFLGAVAVVLSLTWLLVKAGAWVFGPKCPYHRWVVLRREVVNQFPGGLSDSGLPLAPIDLLVYRCPAGDYVRYRVRVGLTPAVKWLWPSGLGLWTPGRRHGFPGHTTEQEWNNLLQSLRREYDGKEEAT